MTKVTKDTDFIIGIDFGHGETSAAYYGIKKPGVSDLEILPGRKAIPSAVALLEQERTETICVGQTAVDNAGYAKDFQISFKKRPSEMNDIERKRMVAFMKGVYAEILNRNPDYKNREHVVYIARPSQDELWKSEETPYMQLAEEAGLPIAGIQKESRAAYFRARTKPNSDIDQYVKTGILIVDYGSSTIDFTYLNDHLSQPIDGGCSLGAAEVEKLILEYAMANPQDEIMPLFARMYGDKLDSIPYNQILFEFRKAKEEFYSNNAMSRFAVLLDYTKFTSSEGSTLNGMRGMAISKDELNNILESKKIVNGIEIDSYKERVKNAVKLFKEHNLKDNKVACVYLTGGASRMDFVRKIFMEVFNLDDAHCPSDENPSVIVSQGVAHLSYADVMTDQTSIELMHQVEDIINHYDWDSRLRNIVGHTVSLRIQEEASKIMTEWKSGSIYETVNIYDMHDRLRYQIMESGLQHVHNLKSLSNEFERVFASFKYNDFAKECESQINDAVLKEIVMQLNRAFSSYNYAHTSNRLSINEISARITPLGIKRLTYKFIGIGPGHIIFDAVSRLVHGQMFSWDTDKNRARTFRENHRNNFIQYDSKIFDSSQWDEFIKNDIDVAGIPEAKSITLNYAKTLVDEYISYARLAIFFK